MFDLDGIVQQLGYFCVHIEIIFLQLFVPVVLGREFERRKFALKPVLYSLKESECVKLACETVFESSLNLLVGHRETSHQKVQWRTDLHWGVEERAP